MNWQDILIRAAKTFLQSFIAVLIAAEVSSVADFASITLWDQAAVAGVAALLSFAQNTLTTLDLRNKEKDA
jgi:hypothetical protein